MLLDKVTTQVPKPAQQASKRNELDELLGRWEEQSRKLTSLHVSFKRTDKYPGWNELIEYEGQAYLQSPDLAFLHLQKHNKKPQEKSQFIDYARFVCTGKKVLEYDYTTKTLFLFPTSEPVRAKSSLNRPFSFLPTLSFFFNVKASELKVRYDLNLLGQTKTSHLLKPVPRLETERRWYRSVVIQLDRTSLLPNRVMIVEANSKDTQEWVFDRIETDVKIDPQFFAHLRLKGWKEVETFNPEEIFNLADRMKTFMAKLQAAGVCTPQ